VPSWLTDTLDALPSETAALYFSLFFVAVAWFGVIFIRPFFRLWLRRQQNVNEIVSFASAGFSLFYGLLLGLLSVAAYNNANEISGYVSREAALLCTLYRNVANYPEPAGSELRYLLRDYTLYTIHKDWPAHQQGQILRGGEHRLQVIRQGLFDVVPTTPSLQLAHANTVRDFNDMVGLREQRLTGVEADLGEMARLQKGRGRDRRAAGLQSEAREAVEDDAREVVEVGDDEGEEADVERLFHQPLQDVLVHAPGPEEPRERDVDHDQRRGKVADLAFDQAEAGIDVGCEGVEEGVDDADVVHGALPD
jgi:hypothetical protein